jgi:drug/metabolite transporter (DMT)-like permease
MSVIFALLAAAAYGVSDFVGGVASRRVHAITVLLVSYPIGALLMLALVPAYSGPISGPTLAWSIAGGLAGLTGVSLLYWSLAHAPMNIVSPVTAVLAAGVPVIAGVIIGERPAAANWVGIVLGMIAVVLISRQADDSPHARVGWAPLLASVIAGIGFGVYFVCLARADTDSGIWPVVLSRTVASIAIVPIALLGHRFVKMPTDVLRLALLAGALDASANVAFLVASRHGLLSLAGVITALYPAGTVLLASVVLKEHTGRVQRAGLAVAVVSVVLLTL